MDEWWWFKRKNSVSPEERKIVAYHRSRSRSVGWFLEHANPLVEITVCLVVLLRAVTLNIYRKNNFLYRTEQLIDEDISVTLGGSFGRYLFSEKSRYSKMIWNITIDTA
jgi:cell division protease FtsH